MLADAAAPARPERALGDRRCLALVVAATVALAAAAAWYYSALGLTLSHYDAKAHLVVARRIFDSLTPGWRQIGAVWLPLPHLLNALPVQVDAFYRAGASGVAISDGLLRRRPSAAVAWLVLRAHGLAAGGDRRGRRWSAPTRTCSTCRRRR